jgi:predicted nucleic acid-binding protein
VTLVIDASAAVEYLLKTALGEQVGRLLAGAELAAPELLDIEVVAVLRREVLRRALTAERAEEAVGDLCLWGIQRLTHRSLLMEAWSLRHNVSAYDAVYVAAARAVGGALVTADGPLSRASNLGVTVYNARSM